MKNKAKLNSMSDYFWDEEEYEYIYDEEEVVCQNYYSYEYRPTGRIEDYHNQNLDDRSFQDKILVGYDFTGASLKRADFTFADLSYANLRSADLSNANFRFAKIVGADLRYANLTYCDMRDCDLSDADLSFAAWQNASWTGAIINSNTVLPMSSSIAASLGFESSDKHTDSKAA